MAIRSSSRFVSSLARPGGNITGLSLATTDTSAKWLELARVVAPESQIGVLADPDQATAQWHLKNIQGAAQKLGAKAPVAYSSTEKDIDGALASLAKQRITAVIVLPSGKFESSSAQIAQAALKYRMASIATTRSYAERGVLLAYGQNYAAFTRRAATYVDKIFRGAKPSELSVEQPTIFELVVNKTTAKQLGITIPKEILLRADSVLE